MVLKCFLHVLFTTLFPIASQNTFKTLQNVWFKRFLKHILKTLFGRRFLTYLITFFQLIPRCFLKTFFKTIFYNALLSTTLLKVFYFEIVVFKTLSRNPYSNAFTMLLKTLCSNALIIYFPYTFKTLFQNALFNAC